MSENNKVVLAYSGGLDTSVAIPWLHDKGYDVIACCINVGEGKDLDFIKQKALNVGAIKAYVIDGLDEFADNYASVALKANAMYEGSYPLISALSRPLISKTLVQVAHQEHAVAVAHGCTGKGNDQVRFEVAIHGLDPQLEVLSPVRDWHWSREQEIEYAKDHNIPIPIDLDSPYSIDANIGAVPMKPEFWKIHGKVHLKMLLQLRIQLKILLILQLKLKSHLKKEFQLS